MSPFQLAKHHGTTSCHRKYLWLSRLPLVIGNTSCHRDYLLLSRLPLVIETTSCHPDYLFLSEALLVIETTSCYREHFLLSKGIFVRLGASYLGPVKKLEVKLRVRLTLRLFQKPYHLSLSVFKTPLSYNREVRYAIVLSLAGSIVLDKTKQVKVCLPMMSKLCALNHLTT